jgi:dTMP kinase
MPKEPKFFGENLPYLKQDNLKGKLIAIEGTDGSGRSTQVALLKNWLEVQGYAVVETGWARSNLMHRSIELAKSGNMMDRIAEIGPYRSFRSLYFYGLRSGLCPGSG